MGVCSNRKQNVQVWEEAKKEIEGIDTNLNDEEIEEYSHQFDDIRFE